MNLVSKPTLFSVAVELLPHVVEGPLGSLSPEEEIEAVQKAARLARLLAKEFSEGAWAPTIEPLPIAELPRPQPPVRVADKKPEWIRFPSKGKCPYSGLSRSTLYNLVGANESNNHRPQVKSILLRRRGGAGGVRLISYDSLMAYISGESESHNPE